MRNPRLVALTCATVAALGVVACGDDEGSSGGTATASEAGSSNRPAGDAIKLGFICSCSGLHKSVVGGTETVIKAWEADVNAAGGINGAPVEVTTKDDGGDPAKALQAAKELVEDDKVIAIVGTTSLADAGWADYVAKAGVPVVGGASTLASFMSNPDWFPSGSNLLAQNYSTVDQAKQAGKTNLGIAYCAESPVCAQLVPLSEGIGKLVGVDITPLKISSTAPNYTAQCQQLENSGVDAVFVANNGVIVQKFMADCAKQNYKPLPVGQAATGTVSYLADPNLQGARSSGGQANPYDTSLPAVKRYQEAVDKYEAGFTEGELFTYAAFLPWTGGLLFEAAAKAGKIDATSTNEDVTGALLSLKNETLDGTSGPLAFTKDEPAFTPCWFTETIDNETLVTANNNKPSCLTDEQAVQLQQALAG